MSILFFDIETTANEEAVKKYLEVYPIKARSNLKDPAKIKADIAAKRKDVFDKAALDADLCTIRSLSWAFGLDGEVQSLVVGETEPNVLETLEALEKAADVAKERANEMPEDEETQKALSQATEAARDMAKYSKSEAAIVTEEKIVSAFFNLVYFSNREIAGYNIIGFDIPVIYRRLMALPMTSVPIMRPSVSRYQAGPTYDLMAILYDWSRETKSMKAVCNLYGIDYPKWDGSQVAGMSNEEVKEYQDGEINAMRQLWQKMNGVYWPSRQC